MQGLLPLVLCFVLAVFPGRSTAQEIPEADAPRPSIAGIMQVSGLADGTAIHLGMAAELSWGPWSLGAAGFGNARPARVEAVAGPDSELSLGYGGVLARYTGRLRPRVGWSGALLLGAGGAEHVDAFGTTVAKDVFFAAEGSVSADWQLAPLASVGARAGYRWVGGVDDLVGPVASDLRSLVLGATLRVFPGADR